MYRSMIYAYLTGDELWSNISLIGIYKQPRICLRGRLQGPLGRNRLTAISVLMLHSYLNPPQKNKDKINVLTKK